tara:strand:- start:1704 stop:2048 length:345 start_codon:yes stop_codon:yes gene_type:complete
MAKLQQTISLPNLIKVGSVDISVQCLDGLVKISEDEGSYDGSKQSIILDKKIVDRGNSYSFLLVWHELCHVIYDHHLLKSAEEEVVVNAMSHGITMIIRDNPELNKWMQQCLMP